MIYFMKKKRYTYVNLTCEFILNTKLLYILYMTFFISSCPAFVSISHFITLKFISFRKTEFPLKAFYLTILFRRAGNSGRPPSQV